MSLTMSLLSLLPALGLGGFAASRQLSRRRDEALYADRVAALSGAREAAPTPAANSGKATRPRFTMRPRTASVIALALTTLGAPCAIALCTDPFAKLQALSASSVVLGLGAFAVLRTAGIRPQRWRNASKAQPPARS